MCIAPIHSQRPCFERTGCSTSTFPPHGVGVLKQAFDRGTPYSVPEWVDLRKSKVEYTFISRGSEVVLVTQAHRFICDKHRQGLIWNRKVSEDPARKSDATQYLGLVRYLHLPMRRTLIFWEELLSLSGRRYASSSTWVWRSIHPIGTHGPQSRFGASFIILFPKGER